MRVFPCKVLDDNDDDENAEMIIWFIVIEKAIQIQGVQTDAPRATTYGSDETGPAAVRYTIKHSVIAVPWWIRPTIVPRTFNTLICKHSLEPITEARAEDPDEPLACSLY